VTSPELITIVPTRSRPFNVRRVVDAWVDTAAFADGAELVFVIDVDDPAFEAYKQELTAAAAAIPFERQVMTWLPAAEWRPLVPKLNRMATYLTETRKPFALGFAGDDHVPRTRGWARAYVDELRDGAGIVYGDDGFQHENIPTEWAMRTEIVTTLGRMVPAPVQHLYCDNAIRDLGKATDLLRYLPHVSIEHMHPVASKAPSDEQYDRVNGQAQYRTDRRAYRDWKRHGLLLDMVAVNDLHLGETS
jgi:hypothetical protein